MKKITIHNYEGYYLDYLEGNLSDTEKTMLFEFLENNPDLKNELEQYGDVLDLTLEVDNELQLNQFDKNDLKLFDCKKDEICLNNVNEFLIADLEGELTEAQSNQLKSFVKEHDLQQSKAYINASVLKPNLSEVYTNKSELKKKGVVLSIIWRAASAAAVLIFVFNYIVNTNSTTQIYQARSNSFKIQEKTKTHMFDFNVKNNATKNVDLEVIYESKNQFAKQDLLPVKDSLIEKSPEKTIQNQPIIAEVPKEIKNKQEQPVIKDEPEQNDDFAELTENPSTQIQLVDMYKPATNLANSYTGLNVSAKKSTPESDYQVTSISIGKFSFERKRKK